MTKNRKLFKRVKRKRKHFKDKTWSCVPTDPQSKFNVWFYDTRGQATDSGMNKLYWRVVRILVKEIK